MRKFAKTWVENYPSIARLNDAIAGPRRMGSEGTVENYIQGVSRFVRYLKLRDDPEAAIQKLKAEGNPTGRVDEFIDHALDKYAHRTVRNFLFGIKKWLELSGVEVAWEKIEFPTSTEASEVDRAPTKNELKALLNHASGSRDRAVILMLASSGLRIGTLLSLTVGDVSLDYPDVARLTVEKKAGRKFVGKRNNAKVYYSWITPEARKSLSEYLEERKRAGEKLADLSPLIGDAYHKGKPITVMDFERVWHRLLNRAGLDMKSCKFYILHVHTLRKFFRSNCVGVDPTYRESWMGHKGGYLDESYFRAEEEKHLAEYRKVVSHLTVYGTSVQEKELRSKMLLDFARLQGYEGEELRRLQDVLAKAKDVDEAISEFRRIKEESTAASDRYAIVEEKELLQKLREGWRLKQNLNGDRYLMARF